MHRMSKKIDYCSLEPIFPNKAFMLFLFILHQDQLIGIVPLDSIYETPEAASEGVSETIKQFETTMGKEIIIPEECLLIPLNRNSLYPLRKGFWDKPTITYSTHMRMKTFAPVIDHPTFYSLLVTPYAFDDKFNKWYLHAALPLIDPTDKAAIERFMLNSDHVVEPRAKHAAFYTLGKKLRFNWQTKEIKHFDNSTKKLIQTHN
jgi:hypothetical protein